VRSRNVDIVDADFSQYPRALALMQAAEFLRVLTNPTSASSGKPRPGPSGSRARGTPEKCGVPGNPKVDDY
jgi:hypothetical protein